MVLQSTKGQGVTFLDASNQALAEMVEDGTYDKIYEKMVPRYDSGKKLD